MKLVWVAVALKELAVLAKDDPALQSLVFKEIERFALDPARFPQRKTINFKMLKKHRFAGRLRVRDLRLLMDRSGDCWVVRTVVRRSDTTYN